MSDTIKRRLEKELHEPSIPHLNRLLRWEMAAVEAYNQCISSIANRDIVPVLEDCRNAHLRRIEKLHDQVAKLGGIPSENAGLLGHMARIVEGGVALLSGKAALNLLADTEDHLLNEYDHQLQSLDPDSMRLVDDELMPAQARSDRMMAVLTSIVYK